MTVLTKPFNEKKSEKPTVPLVGADGQMPSAPLPSVSGDNDLESINFHRRRMSSATTIFLFLSAIAVMCMGILGGVAIYRLCAPSQDRLRFHGYYSIPYESQTLHARSDGSQADNDDFRNYYWDFLKNSTQEIFNPLQNLFRNDLDDELFREEFELDLSADQSYTKINVPDFKDGRQGRFMHDFKVNQSAIIDQDALRCFIMPLDRETVYPPRSLFDLLNKMYTRYYDIDTERVRKTMLLVLPELTDMSDVSPKIAQECDGMKVYRLEKYVNGVYKRAVIPEEGRFASFAGKHIVEYDIMNIDTLSKEN